MKAMILAAGKGERMRPLTDALPKPLLPLVGKPLIVYHLEKLAAAGITDVIINIAYLGEKIRQTLGNGSQWGIHIIYSEEPEPLETGGALNHALDLLGADPFLLVNGDVWIDVDFSQLIDVDLGDSLAHLVFVNNPSHNPSGDFALEKNLVVAKNLSQLSYTFSGVALVHPQLIGNYPSKRHIFPLREVFGYFIEQRRISGMLYRGDWCDVGTPERLAELENRLTKNVR